MPKYTFVCANASCNSSQQLLVNGLTTHVICAVCGNSAFRQMPTLSGQSEVRETVNTHTGTTWRKDQKEILAARQENYLWEVEIPRKVASGTYTLETMLELGWVYVDDHGKIQTYTKPPHKR